MTYAISFIGSVFISFLVHHFGEKHFTQNGARNIRLVVKNYQIHHSFFGALMVLIGLLFLSQIWLVIAAGFGIGNIWQHKVTHNSVKERGMVFITRSK